MKITRGNAHYASVKRSLFGKDFLVLDGTRFDLRDPSISVRCLNKQEYRSLFIMLTVSLLALTIIGIIIAVPLWISLGRRTTATVLIETVKTGEIVAVVNSREWQAVSRYLVM